MLRDFSQGERAVKAKGEVYLPSTKGMKLDGMGSTASGKPNLGQEVYEAYLLRAVFPEYLSDALEIFMGMLHNKSPVIELPPEMEYLRERATELGEPLELLLQRINMEQLTTGRLGLLLDLDEAETIGKPEPFIAVYIAEAVRNWDTNAIGDGRQKLDFVVLDESGFKRDADTFEWKTAAKYRVLQIEATEYRFGTFSLPGGGTPTYSADQMKSPMIRGRKLDKLPFVFINANNISPDVNEPPLLSLARMCGAIYRSEADYRQNLFMQGQDTLVVIGDRAKPAQMDPNAPEEPLRTGAGSRIDLETGGDAKYVGVQSQGLTEQRYALENDRKRGESRSGQLIDASKGAKESGTALRTRVGAQTATLNQIARTGALALESLLKTAAEWMGADPKKVKVTPNMEFADYQMAGQDLVNLMTAKRTGGAPISEESIHRLMVQGNLTNLDYVTERALIDAELPFETPEAKAAREAEAARQVTPPGQAPPSGPGPAPKDPSNPAPTP
jgi:hypothetical protein